MARKTALGRWLEKRRQGKQLGGEIDRLVPTIQARLETFRQDVARIPPGAHVNGLLASAQALSDRLAGLDRSDVAKAATALSMIDEASRALPATIARGPEWARAYAVIEAALERTKTAQERLPAGARRTACEQRHLAIGQRLAVLADQEFDSALAAESALAADAAALADHAEAAATLWPDVQSWTEGRLQALRDALANALPALRPPYAPRVAAAARRSAEARANFDAGDLVKAKAQAGETYFVCEAGRKLLVADGAALLDLLTKRNQCCDAIDVARNDPAHEPLVRQQIARFDAAVHKMDKLETLASASAELTTLINIVRIVRASIAAHAPYQARSQELRQEVRKLQAHPQAAGLAPDIAAIERALQAADDLGASEDGGWSKSKVALAGVEALVAQAGEAAQQLIAASVHVKRFAERLVAEKGLAPDEAKKQGARAARLMVAEHCTPEDALAMVADVADYIGTHQLDERDAMNSARVKRSLVRGGVAPAQAHAVGRNLRVGGTGTIEDAHAVAGKLAKFSAPVLAALNDAGITTHACRGPVTEVLASLSGELPRGWPAGRTWDTVPGVSSGAANCVVIGTMEGPGGSRKVPGKAEGPVPHGTPDLIGHEAGHAFDRAGGGLKSQTPAFLAARQADIDASPRRIAPGADNYFLTKAEGGTNDAGATSETFAESFAIHFSGTVRWTSLHTFWQTNPWGV